MNWKPVTGQLVIANIGGRVRELVVTDWNPYTGAVRVAWPPLNPTMAARHRFSKPSLTELGTNLYEPLDPDGFIAETKGERP